MAYNAALASVKFKFNEHTISAALWYPCDAAETSFPTGLYEFSVAKNAPALQKAFPLILMSHGSGGTRYGHCKTAEFLARQGYIVLAPEHPGNNFFDDSKSGTADSYQNRSRHIIAALHYLLDHQDKYSLEIDREKIGVFGFSLGGFTALCCVGAKPDVSALSRHIKTNREFDPLFTSYQVVVRDGVTEGYLDTAQDELFKFCIALAPVSGGMFSTKESLAGVKAPVLLFRAERDMVLRDPFHAREIKDNLSTSCEYHITKKAGHFSYLSPARTDIDVPLGEFATDNDDFNRQAEHDRLHQLVACFLEKSLS